MGIRWGFHGRRVYPFRGILGLTRAPPTDHESPAGRSLLISVQQSSKNGVGQPGARKRQPGDLLVIGVLLVLTALPDAMVVPILEELLVVRYGVDPGLSHAFISINLIGGLCALPLLRIAMRRGRPILAVAFAAIADAALLAAMWLPIGFGPTILLRAVEGAEGLQVAVVERVAWRVGEEVLVPAAEGQRR